MSKSVAVILSGCGFLDGAEIRESVLALMALDAAGASVKVFAPDKDQHHVINHLRSEESQDENRNVLEESARIARGDISPLSELSADQFDALVMPGGFGVAKNLCTFAFDGPEGTVDPKVKSVIENFYEQRKPMGAICISPALMSMVLGKHGIKLTIGQQEDVAKAIESTGAKHERHETAKEVCIDQEHKIISTPAYMFDEAKVHHVYEGIHQLVNKTLEMA